MPVLRVLRHPRVADFLARVRRDPTAWTLIGSNLVALVLALGHPPVLASLLAIYWGQCLIIGLFIIVKIFFLPLSLGPGAEGRPVLRFVLLTVAKVFLAAFFVLNYGFLVAITGGIIEVISGEELKIRTGSRRFDLLRYMIGLAGPLAIFVVSHAVSFVKNFLLGGEYRHRTLEDQASRGFPRALGLFLVVFFGAGLLSITQSPGLLIVVLVPLKLVADLIGHVYDHRDRES